ncbi:MAG: hypothetical protein NTY53_17715 [Kiritimatiellaeota bacterium]|nr:hypothetical protein [Kiritimatiellota bacterium]
MKMKNRSGISVIAVVVVAFVLSCVPAKAQWRDNSGSLPDTGGTSQARDVLLTLSIGCLVVAAGVGVWYYLSHKDRVDNKAADHKGQSKVALLREDEDSHYFNASFLRDEPSSSKIKPYFDVVSKAAGDRTEQVVLAGMQMSF